VKDEVDGVKTYASYCTRESDNSSECPQEVHATCVNIRPSGIPGLGDVGTCSGRPWAQCQRINGVDVGCDFTARNFWPSGTVNDTFLWGMPHNDRSWLEDTKGIGNYLGQWNRKFENREEYPWNNGESNDRIDDSGIYYATTYLGSGDQSLADSLLRSYEGKEEALAAFWPAVSVDTCFGEDYDLDESPTPCTGDDHKEDQAWNQGEHTPFWPTWLVPSNTVTYEAWDDTSLLSLYPGFNPFIFYIRTYEDSARYCSYNLTGEGHGHLCADQPLQIQRYVTDGGDDEAPYLAWNRSGDYEANKQKMFAQYGACESLALMYRELGDCTDHDDDDETPMICVEGPSAGQECQFDSDCAGGGAVLGTCRGGGRDGESCNNDVDCRPPQLTQSQFEAQQAASASWCNPVTTGKQDPLSNSYLRPLNQAGTPAAPNESGVADDCWPASCTLTEGNTSHPQREEDTALDCNICTHPPGYWPRPQWCDDPNDEYCGLFGYYLPNKAGSVQDTLPLPTDVTQGLYSPLELNPAGVPNDVSGSAIDYAYLDRYAPVPPQVAAPDVRTCQGTQCRVSSLGTFALNGLAGGLVNGGVGNHVATMRFYAWAAHDQMPMRRITIDWGDGNVTEVPDAHMKNRKPYCQTSKECTETPGLTCQTDADCPPGGGLCATWGNCSNDPNRKCYNDRGCDIGGVQGFCEPRVPFGNDQDACDENFFEFRHAYTCPADVADSSLPSCGDTRVRRCANDWNRTCDSTADCEPGDACVETLAPPSDPDAEIGGCYDASNNRCLYTPRVMVVDNWGWCSGECRNDFDVNGNLVDTYPRGASEFILHPNGGCYDGSAVKRNNNFSEEIGINECDGFTPTTAWRRPWIVFPGSLQLLPGIEL
jgi:hypothetical protein